MVVANTVNNVVVSSGTQGVSRVVAGAQGHEDEALRAALRVHVRWRSSSPALMAVARRSTPAFERAQDVARAAARAGGGRAALRRLRAAHRVCSTGATASARQALLDVTFATLRTVGPRRPRLRVRDARPLGRARHDGRLGRRRGAHRAAGAALDGDSARRCRAGAASRGRAHGARLPRVLGPIAGAQLCTNLLMQIDITLLGSLPQRRGRGRRGWPATRSARR